MTKIAYIRATSRQQHQQPAVTPSSPIMMTSPIKPSVTLQPPIPSMITKPLFPSAKVSRHHQRQQNLPKPMIMTATTRFNTNPTILIFDQQNGGRISKPLMEKRRRARINQCLSQLKTIVVDSAGQYTQNNKCKLEKADILELTVNYVKQLHLEHQRQKLQPQDDQTQYLSGYTECVRQVCEYLSNNHSVQDVRDDHKHSIKEYLHQCLSLLHQSHNQQQDGSSTQAFVTPPSPAPSSESSSNGGSTSSNSPDTNSTSVLRPKENRKQGFEQSTFLLDHHLHTRSDEEEMTEDDEEDDDYDDMIYSDIHHNNNNNESHPLNLKVNSHHHDHLVGVESTDDDVWRPW